MPSSISRGYCARFSSPTWTTIFSFSSDKYASSVVTNSVFSIFLMANPPQYGRPCRRRTLPVRLSRGTHTSLSEQALQPLCARTDGVCPRA